MTTRELGRRPLGLSLRKRVPSALSTLPARRWLRDRLLRNGDRGDLATFREDLARRYLRGDGIEIGALHRPLRLPPEARVRYVDIMTRDELLATHSSEVYGNPRWVVETDVVDDGERLTNFADRSVDFVVANHMLEHTEDPILALSHLLRTLRPGGVLYLTLPDARQTFDASRPRTSVDHLAQDHGVGPEWSRQQHYREWAQVECLAEAEIERRIAEFAERQTRHHFHVWELDGFLEFVLSLRLDAGVELAQTHLDEFAVILRRHR